MADLSKRRHRHHSPLSLPDKVFNICKNFFALTAIGLVIWLYSPFFSVLRREFKVKKEQLVLDKFSILSAEFKVSSEKLGLADKLNTPEIIQGEQDVPVSSTAK